MARSPLPRLRKLCLGYPEATEKEAWGSPTFRVRDKLFAHYVSNHHGDGITAVWCKAPPGDQAVLVESDPERFYVPPYVGPRGWIGMRLDVLPIDWDEVAEVLLESYRLTAPKRLAALLADPPLPSQDGGRTG